MQAGTHASKSRTLSSGVGIAASLNTLSTYCSAKYDGENKCSSPVLREDEIKAAIEVVFRQLGKERTKYTDALWRKTVEKVTVHPDGKLEFQLKSGETATYHF